MAGRRRIPRSLIFGTVLGLAGLVFVVAKIADQWSEVRDRLTNVGVGWLVLGVVLAVAGMTGLALAWRGVLVALGAAPPDPRAVVRWYYVGEIGKYVPGGIWTVVGRAELARRAGLDRTSAYGSVALSLVLMEVAAACVAAIALPFSGLAAGHATVWLVLLVVPIGLAMLHPGVLRPVLALVERLTHRTVTIVLPSFATTLRLVVGYVPAWIGIGTATWAIARSVDRSAPFGVVFTAAVISWIIGFLVLAVPGGVGVREAAFTALWTAKGGAPETTALLARLVFMVVDAAGAVLAPIVFRAHGAAVRDDDSEVGSTNPGPRATGAGDGSGQA